MHGATHRATLNLACEPAFAQGVVTIRTGQLGYTPEREQDPFPITEEVLVESTELRRSTLERKDRDELVTIATALGTKPPSRARKSEIVDLIIKTATTDTTDASDSTDDADVALAKKGPSARWIRQR